MRERSSRAWAIESLLKSFRVDNRPTKQNKQAAIVSHCAGQKSAGRAEWAWKKGGAWGTCPKRGVAAPPRTNSINGRRAAYQDGSLAGLMSFDANISDLSQSCPVYRRRAIERRRRSVPSEV